MRTPVLIGCMLGVLAVTSLAQPAPVDERTPPRLSLVDGQVSFWRPGAQDWATAQINTPLAPGDELYAASPGNLEIQVGARAFVRTWANTQIGLASQEPDFLQFKVTSGIAAVDLRSIEPGHTVELDTPNAAFTLERAGFYRVEVSAERTAFITRRGGRATLIPAGGQSVVTNSSEEVVIEGPSGVQLASYAAPPLDAWDQWNYARSEQLLDAVSARYVSPGTYGASDLDPYGNWRSVPDYGSVWVPTGVPAGWAPYSTGSWTLDPYYGWTWVDSAPWGWAPYHYGRWVFVNGFWAWAPGPVLARPVYAPALVAFFGTPGVRVGVDIGGPRVGWVALGWGEPVVPWWGRMHEATWRGWGGPRVVNNTVVNNTTVVKVQNITVYRNASVQNAVVTVNREHFGRGPIAREARVEARGLQPIHGAPQVAAAPASFVPIPTRALRPPEESAKRPVVATRPWPVAPAGGGAAAAIVAPAPRVVAAPVPREAGQVPARPPLGRTGAVRPSPERSSPLPPQAPEVRGARPAPEQLPAAAPPVARSPQPERERREERGTANPSGTAPQAARPVVPDHQRREERGTASPSGTAQQAARPLVPDRQRREERGMARPPEERRAAPPAAAPMTATPPALPGEPANRMAPHRAEKQERPRGQR